MLEVDPETRIPYVFQKVYQHAFTAMYLLATILNAPPPPHDLLLSKKEGIQVEEAAVEAETAEAIKEKIASDTEHAT